MLVNTIRNLGIKYNLMDIDFEKVFRDRALRIDNIFDSLLNIEISDEEFYIISKEKSNFFKLFFEKDSSKLFWVCRCLYRNNISILAYLNDYIKNICNITRGNLNTYKLNGWDVHVLYVYQLVTYNFPQRKLPKAYVWDFNANPIFEKIHRIYSSLSEDSKFILKIGGFLHDIGVTIGVKDHEENGIPLTERYYNEIKIDTDILKKQGITLNNVEIITAVRAIVGNHQIINQIGCETSDLYIWQKIESIKQSFKFSKRLRDIFNKEFIDIMTILAISDMMAVDDSLLSLEKFAEVNESYEFLNNIIKTGNYTRNRKKYGIGRLVSLLPDNLKHKASEYYIDTLDEYNPVSLSVINFLYEVKFMSYAMAAIKPLKDIKKSLNLIIVCNQIYKQSSIIISDLTIKFNPDINNEKLSLVLESEPSEILSKNLIKYYISDEKNIIEIDC